MHIFFFIKKHKIYYKNSIRKGFLSIFGISLYKFNLIKKGRGHSLIHKKKKEVFKNCLKPEINWFKFFLKQNFLFGTDLKHYLKGKRLKYLLFYNFKGMRMIHNLPVRGQRTQTNRRTIKKNSFFSK